MMSASMFTNPPSNPSRAQRLRRAFSLIEVVVAITILALITTSLFAIIRGAVRGATEIEILQREADQIQRFLDLLRKTFSTLPSTATLTLTALDGNASDAQELTISGSPRCFGFGTTPISYNDTILGLRPDLDGATDQNGLPIYNLSISREDIIPRSGDQEMALRQEASGLLAADEEGRNWMPLLPGVTQLKWRFYQEEEDAWLEEWEESEWPQLVEVQLVMRDRTTPIRMVCGLPVIEITAGRSSGGGGGGSTAGQQGPPSAAAAAAGGGGRGGPGGGGPPGGRGGPGGGRGGPGGGRPPGGGGGPPGGGPPGGGPPGGGPGGGGPPGGGGGGGPPAGGGGNP